MSSCSPPHRRGYVLLLTLVSLALVAAGLAGVARRSHAAAAESGRLEREAQRRWLAATAEPLLPHVDALLTAPAPGSNTPGSNAPATSGGGTLRVAVTTPHGTAGLTLSDEQAKANVNALWERHDRAIVQSKLATLAAEIGDASIRLRPVGAFEATASGAESDWPAFAAFEQVLAPEHRQRQRGEPTTTSSLPDHVTLWGDGRLRPGRATRPALEAVLRPLLSDAQIDQLIALPPTGRDAAAATGRHGLRLTDRQREQLQPRLTDESRCFGLRLRFDDGQRVRTRLVIWHLPPETPGTPGTPGSSGTPGTDRPGTDRPGTGPPDQPPPDLVRFDG